jgi:3-hydroxymyristoyl/3-hydroxydecanoyl-(acyl carrier protein) dehydratase
MRLLLVDRLTNVVPWKSARATKLVSAAEDFIQMGRSGYYMPRGLVLECAFQAAAWLIVISSSLKLRPAVLRVSDVRWFGEARPGDRMESQVRILQHDDDVAEVSGETYVGGTKILEVGSGLCALLPTLDLDTPGGTEWMIQQITSAQPERALCDEPS